MSIIAIRTAIAMLMMSGRETTVSLCGVSGALSHCIVMFSCTIRVAQCREEMHEEASLKQY